MRVPSGALSMLRPDAEASAFSPRATCDRCRRPAAYCWCPHLVSLPTRTRVVLLQHPRERGLAIGTAYMASLCLPNAELHVGTTWGDSPALARALSDPGRPAVLLYPGEEAVDLFSQPPEGPVTLVVVDGTWSTARKVVARNPVLSRLPRYAFSPPAPGEYRIRREPTAACVSTLEALVYALGALEREPERFRAMLAPFRAMIDAQLAAESTLRHHRGRAPRAPRPPRARPPSPLRGRLAEVLCVAGEANAWPRPAAGGVAAWPDEVVQWVAHRPATGETFEAIVAPGHPIAPATASHTGLDDATLRQGEALSAALRRWRAFLRDTDLVCAWGPYGTDLWQAAGAHLPPARLDLRVAARTDLHGKAGTPAEYLSRLGGHAEGLRPLGLGRAGTRVAQLAAIARCLAGPP